MYVHVHERSGKTATSLRKNCQLDGFLMMTITIIIIIILDFFLVSETTSCKLFEFFSLTTSYVAICGGVFHVLKSNF